MNDKPRPTRREAYSHFTSLPTRWADNDVYGHVNNVVYYSFFDTAVNRHLIEQGVLDITGNDIVGLVIETTCTYFSSVSFPDTVHVGLKVVHLGKSSVRYETAVFCNDSKEASAVGQFVHVYVDRATNRPTAIPDRVRTVLNSIASWHGSTALSNT